MMQLSHPITPKKLFVLAGEVSGDMHAAGPVRTLLDRCPDVRVFGVGGSHLQALGADLLYSTAQLSIMGFVEVARHAFFLGKVVKDLKNAIARERPDAALLVDYPGMNLLLARFLHELHIPVIYYISPQLWAWKEGRVEKIRAWVDRLLVIFDFEVEFYRRHGIKAEFVGNPVVEELAERSFPSRQEFLHKKSVDPDCRLVGLLPGSRRQEVEKIFPEMLGAARILHRTGKVAFLLGRASHLDTAFFDRYLKNAGIEPLLCSAYEVMKYSDLVLVTSGTVTLEALCFGVPMVVLYRMGGLNYMIGKRLVKVKSIALANIVAKGLDSEDRVVPELLQKSVNAEEIALAAQRILFDERVADQMKKELFDARSRLSSDSPSEHVARVLMEYLS